MNELFEAAQPGDALCRRRGCDGGTVGALGLIDPFDLSTRG
jgi:hypothetical protein